MTHLENKNEGCDHACNKQEDKKDQEVINITKNKLIDFCDSQVQSIQRLPDKHAFVTYADFQFAFWQLSEILRSS